MDPRLEHIRRLVSWRSRPDRATSIATELAPLAKRLRDEARRRSAFGEAWCALVPPALADRATATDLRAGALTVVADDASTGWELDRALRGGLEAALRAATQGAVQRVRVRVGSDRRGEPRR